MYDLFDVVNEEKNKANMPLAERMRPVLTEPNIPTPTLPMTNSGPEVEQKVDIFVASTSEISPFSPRSPIIFAPTG